MKEKEIEKEEKIDGGRKERKKAGERKGLNYFEYFVFGEPERFQIYSMERRSNHE